MKIKNSHLPGPAIETYNIEGKKSESKHRRMSSTLLIGRPPRDNAVQNTLLIFPPTILHLYVFIFVRDGSFVSVITQVKHGFAVTK